MTESSEFLLVHSLSFFSSLYFWFLLTVFFFFFFFFFFRVWVVEILLLGGFDQVDC